MAKNIEIGNLIVKNGIFLALGKKSLDDKYKKYDLTVELVVKDSSGKVVARQTDGFISLNDPRTQAEELLAKNIITEEEASRMRLRKVPESIKYTMSIPKL